MRLSEPFSHASLPLAQKYTEASIVFAHPLSEELVLLVLRCLRQISSPPQGEQFSPDERHADIGPVQFFCYPHAIMAVTSLKRGNLSHPLRNGMISRTHAAAWKMANTPVVLEAEGLRIARVHSSAPIIRSSEELIPTG